MLKAILLQVTLVFAGAAEGMVRGLASMDRVGPGDCSHGVSGEFLGDTRLHRAVSGPGRGIHSSFFGQWG